MYAIGNDSVACGGYNAKMLDMIPLANLRAWGAKGGLTIADQGLFSGANFVLTVLLARWLEPAQYGAFTIGYIGFLLGSGFHNAFIVEPMSVLGPAKYSGSLGNYFFGQLKIHGITTAVLSLLFIAAGATLALVGQSLLRAALWGAGLALPFMLLIWFTRRLFYVVGRPEFAMLGSLAYALVLVSSAVAARQLGYLSISMTYALLGVASVVGAGASVLLGKAEIKTSDRPAPTLRRLLGEQLRYGRWIAGASVMSFAANQIQALLLAGLVGLAAAGALEGLQNFSSPMVQVVTAASTLALPTVAYDFGRGHYDAIRKKALLLAGVMTASAACYELLLIAFPGRLEHALYGGKYGANAQLIPILGLVPLLMALNAGLAVVMRAIQRPQYYLIYGAIAAATGLVSGIVFTTIWGLAGAAWSLVLTSVATLCVHFWLYKGWFLPNIQQRRQE